MVHHVDIICASLSQYIYRQLMHVKIKPNTWKTFKCILQVSLSNHRGFQNTHHSLEESRNPRMADEERAGVRSAVDKTDASYGGEGDGDPKGLSYRGSHRGVLSKIGKERHYTSPASWALGAQPNRAYLGAGEKRSSPPQYQVYFEGCP